MLKKDGSALTGRALTRYTVVGGVEYLVLAAAIGEVEVPMHKTDTVKVRTPGARFSILTFDTRIRMRWIARRSYMRMLARPEKRFDSEKSR